jgi:hypothetical protein
MNPHLNVFNNYRELNAPLENNLTRSFIITLKYEPQLLRDFLFLVNGEYSWDDIYVSIQDKNIDITGFENIIGVAITSKEIDNAIIDGITAQGSDIPIPDFLIYNSKTLIIGEIKKHSENPIAQLKNQVQYLLNNHSQKGKNVVTKYKAFSWTEILSQLIIPYQNFNKANHLKTIWPSEFKEYIATHYSDWLPVPTLDRIDFTTEKDSITRQFIEKRFYSIQSLTKFGAPQYWIGGRMTMPINLGWATEAQVKLEKYRNHDYVCITIWPADTKSQGYQIFHKDLAWVYQESLKTVFGEFEISNNPYIKFSHVMGRWIGAINFTDEFNELGKRFHNKEHFEQLCGSWYRAQWEYLESILDEEFSNEFDWRDDVNWDMEFKTSGRNFVFVSMGFECSIYVPFENFQDLERQDPTGKKSATLLEIVIDTFKELVNGLRS